MNAVEDPKPSPESVQDGQAPQGTAAKSVAYLASKLDLAVALPKRIFEIGFELTDSTEELRKKIAWIIRIRFAVNPAVVLLMLLTNWQGLTRGASTLSRETLISTALTGVISVLINGIYIWALRKKTLDLRKFVFLQLVLDVIIFSAYIWRTGGVTSPFAFLYFLPIIGGSILLGPGSGMGMAGISAGVFASLVALENWGLIPHVSYFVALDQFAQRWSYIVLTMLVNFFAFVAVAGASGFMIRQVHAKTRELRESNLQLKKQADLFGMLYQVSEVLQHHDELDDVVDRICDVLVNGLDVDRALMYVAEGGELKLRRVAYHERVPEAGRTPMRVSIPMEASEGLTARCALENSPMNVTEPEKQDGINVELAQRIGMNPFALAPMTYRSQVMGVLGIDRSSRLGVIKPNEFETLILFARQAGQTLAAGAKLI
ncbi:MAG: GAF domain-containing protein [Deltaproteobacteria bacterium]|nr:GAF domain-containing protein [Deltaproteobacteria bacterium]